MCKFLSFALISILFFGFEANAMFRNVALKAMTCNTRSISRSFPQSVSLPTWQPQQFYVPKNITNTKSPLVSSEEDENGRRCFQGASRLLGKTILGFALLVVGSNLWFCVWFPEN